MPLKIRPLSKTLIAAVLAAMPAGIAFGQASQPAVQVPQRGGLNPDSFYGKETFQGVSVRDSLEAVKKIEDARRMERLEDWNKAADWYQEVIEKYGQYVVPSGTDAQNNIRQYTGIERPVQEQLAKWPKSGLDSYRNRYGAVATTMLDQARQDDRETLSRVMKLYFVTEAGKQAGIRLVDLLLEGGEFAEAARVGDRLIDWHPTLVVERPKVLFRTALAYHLSGDDTKAKERADQLKNKHAGAVGTLFGKDIVLSDALERLLQVAAPVSVATATGSVRMNPGGDASRSMISAANGRPGARLATIDYSSMPASMRGNVNAGVRRGMQVVTDQGQGGDQSIGLGVLPVADAGELYFQDGSHVYAVSLQSGVPLPGWMQSYPNSNGQFAVNSFGQSQNQQHSLTLTDNAVLGVMGFSERLMNYGMPVYGSDRGTRLVCLDRGTGKEKWVARPGKIAEENLRALDFSGSPLVVADNVYIIGRGGKNPTSEDCYVLCFDLATGAYKWSCFIASSSNAVGYNQFNGQMNVSDSLSHLAYSSGRIYILTNLGAAGAIDAYSGTVSWLNIYPRDNSAMNPNMMWQGGMARSGSGTKSWEFNPVIVQEGRVFILPTDSKYIIVYDAGTGAELKRIETSDIQSRISERTGTTDNLPPAALLGVDNNQLILTGGNSVYCVDWTKAIKDCIVWHCPFATPIKGRGFVTATSVFVSNEPGASNGASGQGALWRIDRSTGKRKESYPSKKDWDEGEGPGNIIVVGDEVVVAGLKRVNVYADMGLARKRLDDDVAAAPTDPEPRLRYAEVMFVAGQLPVAMEKIGETVKLLGGTNSLRPGPEREHLFSDCLTFAAKLQKDLKRKSDTSSEQIQQSIDAVTPLYDLAAAAADGDSQQVNYRMSRAKFNREFAQDDSLASAVALYQEILSSQHLRTVPLTEETLGIQQAADVAEQMINEVKKLKPQAYDKFEKLAVEALQAAGEDPALLKSVADTYPNSTAAPKAMTNAAAAYEAQGTYEGHRLAAYTLRQVYNKYGDAADKPRILEAMARNYLAMPETSSTDRAGTANARLSGMVKLGAAEAKLSKPLKLADNKVLAEAGVTINDALKAVQNYKAQTVSAKLPDYHITPAPTDENRLALQDATAKWLEEGAHPDKKPHFPDPFVSADQQLIIGDVSALVKPPIEIRDQVSRYDRVVVWSNGNLLIYPVGSKEPVGRSGELTTDPKNIAWLDNASLLVWSDSEMVLLDGTSGAKKWERKLALKSLPKIEVVAGGADDAGAAPVEQIPGQVFINGNQRMILRQRIINGRVGQVIVPAPIQGAAAPAGPEAIASVRPIDDKIIVATTAGQLFAVQGNSGKIVWHTRLSASAPISRIAATDDFVVAKVDDATSTQLVVLNTYDGQLARRFPFSNESGNVPVNFALAPDGTLVWIQQDRLCGKDLFEPGKEPNYTIIAGQDARANGAGNINVQMDGQVFNPIYQGATNADQLLISEGRILVVNNTGKYVSLHSLEKGTLLDYKEADGRRAEARLSTVHGDNITAVNDWGVSLNLVGSKLYVCTRQNGPVCYNLDKSGMLWGGYLDKRTVPNVQIQEPFIGQDYMVLVDRPAAAKAGVNAGPNVAANVGGNAVRLECYTRAALDASSGRESGRLGHSPYIRDESGISDLQGVDGGFYYLTGDKKLHFLKGARP
jgi:outer membrane protein assembly factor BamB